MVCSSPVKSYRKCTVTSKRDVGFTLVNKTLIKTVTFCCVASFASLKCILTTNFIALQNFKLSFVFFFLYIMPYALADILGILGGYSLQSREQFAENASQTPYVG